MKRILLLLFFVIITFCLLPFDSSASVNSFEVYFLFVINGVLILSFFISDLKIGVFTCRSFHWLFCFFFLFLAPLIQTMAGVFPLDVKPSINELVTANLLILLWILLVKILLFAFGKNRKKVIKEKSEVQKDKISNSSLKLFNIVVVMFVFFMITRVGLTTILFSRSGGESAFDFGNTAVSSLITYVIRNIITFNALYNIYAFKHFKKNYASLVLSLVLLLIGCSPIGMPRYQVAVVYMGCILVFLPRLKKSLWLVVIFIISFMFLFPTFDAFRYATLGEISFFKALSYSISNIKNEYLTANYDAYIMIIKSLRYTAENGHQFGLQFLGSILFFIPRGLWPNKPISTGTLIQNYFGFYRDAANVSSSLITEGLVDFGLFGILFYAILFVALFSYLDKMILTYEDHNRNSIVCITFPTMIFFLCRGPLLSVFGFLISFIVVGYLFSKASRMA